VKKRLLEFIACPCCAADFRLSVSRAGEEIESATLACANGHSFTVSEGIPRLVVAELLPESQRSTQESFSEKWERIPDWGYDKKTKNFQLQWYLQRYGWGSLQNLTDFLATQQFILDAGTGLGRDAKLYSENTGGQVFAIDISSRAINTAYSHLGHLPNLHLIQADLTRLPFRESFFDFIACDQVIHHTPNTEESFKRLVRFLKPGGEIAVYVYAKKGPIREFCDDYIRSYTTKLSAEECYRFSEAITKLGKSLSELNVEISVPEDIPLLQIEAGKYDLQRFIYWNVLKCFWNPDFDFNANVMVNFDWYHPKDAHRHTPEEVRKWFDDAGLEIIHFDVSLSGTSVRAKKVE